MLRNIKAFTLVELIVVITILAILGTIGFISLQGYSVNARDSVRIADTKTFIKALNIYQTKEGEVPLPDNTTTITGSGVVFSYQGTLSGSVITALGQGAVPVDPTLQTPYLYATNKARTKFQLLSYHERNTATLNLTEDMTFAATNYADMYPKVIGDEVGILLQEDNSPIVSGSLAIHELVDNYKYIFSDDRTSIGSGLSLVDTLRFTDCKDILDNLGAVKGSDVYTIYTNDESLEVYCDMEIDGGGWTMLYNQSWQDNEKISGNIDANVGDAGFESEHTRDPDIFFSSQHQLLLMQEYTFTPVNQKWLLIDDVSRDDFDTMFHHSGTSGHDFHVIKSSSSGSMDVYMDQDNHSTGGGVYQWNDVNGGYTNHLTCFEYSKNGVDNNHEWIVYPLCNGQYSAVNADTFSRRAMVFVR